jgi:peptidoglycan/LPS O-acetylase OafA/YrhL
MRRWFWVLDALVVISFVVIGREDHGFVSNVWDYMRVAAPFLIGLVIAIFVARAWRHPVDITTGLALAFGTLLIGMLFRRFVWDDGTARTFVIITAAFFVAGMIGWRIVVIGIRKVMEQRRPVTG